MKKKDTPVAGNGITLIDENLLKSKVYTIRGVKVMLDADLAEIYGYSTKDFNRQVKNNIERFPEIFRFQLTMDEIAELSRCKNCTSMQVKGVKGGRVYLPYAFTEQGIYMLMTVLKGELAIKQSIAIMLLFKEMKDYIAAENQQLLGCSNCVQIATLTAQHSHEIAEIRTDVARLEVESLKTQESLGKVMEFFHDPSTYKHHLILNGQKLEADVAYTQIYGMAQKSIFVFDDFVGVKTLDLLRGVAQNVNVTIFSDQRNGCALTQTMIDDFKAARPDVSFEWRPAGGIFHDRYIVLDYGTSHEKMFH
ncbi:ORF6N domain-containing protein, partial [Fibrobacter sp. HC4]|uniref:ORF6N domain-containing protein n=1 Tax=Fibrobacter sp. HC4 TaxID=3239812 RepID=UPI00201921F0